ncbi:hypothetical protein Scep_001050 [Stephania cephalantha]|uniref:Uncharacterized protein n=1 Tax=Stephania cephalantha TaxID=152367 RepID=A0AAP0LB10_9MAGN
MKKKSLRIDSWICAAVAFGIGVAYKEGVGKASLFLLGFGWDHTLQAKEV